MLLLLDQIEVRKKNRQRRAKEEKRREKRIEIEECRQMERNLCAHNLHLESNVQFPEFGVESRSITESQCTSTVDNDELLATTGESTSSFSGPSFATVSSIKKVYSISKLQYDSAMG